LFLFEFKEYERFYTRHTDFWKEINDIIQEISSEEWKSLKRRYYYAKELSIDQRQEKKDQIFSQVFEAQESAMPISISRYELVENFNISYSLLDFNLPCETN